MITIDKKNHQAIHTRNIKVATYVCGDDAIIVEGQLKDHRLVDSYRSGGDVIPPGVIHNMIIRLKIRGPGLVIEDIDVEMPSVPNEDCLETRQSLEPIKGMSIISGFTLKVKESIGGVKGCAHLTALLTAMAPAAVQGGWTAAARHSDASPALMTFALERLKDTCHVWRSDGPAFSKMQAVIAEADTVDN
jgi:hypothetical protein